MSLAESPVLPASRAAGRSLLVGAEPLLMALLLAAAGGFAGLAAVLGQAVDWTGMARALGPAAFLLGLGAVARRRPGMDRLALLLFAVGFYVAFGNLLGVLIYLRFPLGAPPIDPLLMRLDAMLGYDWAAGVAALAERPALGRVLTWVYLSSLWQLLLLIGVLSWRRQAADLHRLLLTGALSLVLTVALWWLWPSLGPATLAMVPPDVQAAARLVVDGAYAAELHRLAAEGNAVLSPDRILGTVAFPSYHIVMAALVVRFARGTGLFWPALALNLLMVPATMLQGGHHAVDLLGGIVTFGAGLLLASRLVPIRGA